MNRPRKIVEGATVIVLREGDLSIFALRQSEIPVGLGFRDSGNGWGVIDVVRWDRLNPDHRADSAKSTA